MNAKTENALQPYVDEIYAHPGFLLRRANQMSVAIFAKACEELVTPPQFSALLLVKLVPGIDQTGVARLMGFDRTTSALVIANMVKQGWISRQPDQRDGRRYRLEITAAGLAMIDKVTPRAEQAEQRMLSPFSKQEQRQFVALLERFVAHFNDDSNAPIDAATLPMTQFRLGHPAAPVAGAPAVKPVRKPTRKPKG